MRKMLFVLLGLLLIAGAAGMGYFRHVHEPRSTYSRTTASAPQGATRSAQPQAAARPSGSQSAAKPATGQPSGGTQISSFQIFETVVNVLNVVVGVVGIWLAIAGIRMQKAAAAAMQRRE